MITIICWTYISLTLLYFIRTRVFLHQRWEWLHSHHQELRSWNHRTIYIRSPGHRSRNTCTSSQYQRRHRYWRRTGFESSLYRENLQFYHPGEFIGGSWKNQSYTCRRCVPTFDGLLLHEISNHLSNGFIARSVDSVLVSL